MALWGEIKVNNEVIAAWSAVRVEKELNGPNRIYHYKCAVAPTGRPGVQFDVYHRYSDGALALMETILRRARIEGVTLG